MARISCGASLADGHRAEATRRQTARGLYSIMVAAPDFVTLSSADGSDSYRSGSLGFTPEFATHTHLTGGWLEHVSGLISAGAGNQRRFEVPLLLQTYGG